MPSIRGNLPALITLSAMTLADASCDPTRACGEIGCDNGLTVVFRGGNAGSTYRLEVASVTPLPETVPFVRCFLEVLAANSNRLSCSSAELHREFAGRLVINDLGLKNVLVSVFLSDQPLTQQQFQIVYATSEVNGPGCGTCTHASIEVSIPPP
jgi:hypothetical protein